MPRLVWVFAGRTAILLGFVMSRLYAGLGCIIGRNWAYLSSVSALLHAYTKIIIFLSHLLHLCVIEESNFLSISVLFCSSVNIHIRRVFDDNLGIIFVISPCCGYSLESPPHRGDSNEYPQQMFLLRTIENYPLIIINYPPHLFYCWHNTVHPRSTLLTDRKSYSYHISFWPWPWQVRHCPPWVHKNSFMLLLYLFYLFYCWLCFCFFYRKQYIPEICNYFLAFAIFSFCFSKK